MSEPTTLASWTRALRKQLDALGLDSAELCRQAQLDPALMDDPNARYPLSATTRLWQLAVAASGDPALGLKISTYVSPTTFHALGYALVASASLREVFERIVRYHQVVSDALELELRRQGDRYQFRLRVPSDGPEPAPEALDAFAAIYVRTCRNRLGRDYAPLAVHLRRPQPADPQPWHQVFRAPLSFGAEENLLEFAVEDFERPLEKPSCPMASLPRSASPSPCISACAACNGTWRTRAAATSSCSAIPARRWPWCTCATRAAPSAKSPTCSASPTPAASVAPSSAGPGRARASIGKACRADGSRVGRTTLYRSTIGRLAEEPMVEMKCDFHPTLCQRPRA
jgi:hypothetical protein